MKNSAFVLFTLLLLGACSEKEDLTRVNLSQLSASERQDLKKELLDEMREEAKAEMKKNSYKYLELEPTFFLSHFRFPMEIKINSRNELFFNGKPTAIDKIPFLIHRHYTFNRGLSEKQLRNTVGNARSPRNAYPFYFYISRKEILEYLKKAKKYKLEAAQAKNYEVVEYHGHKIRDWKMKLRIMTLLKTNELKEIRPQGILVTYENDRKGFSAAADTALVGIYRVRNTASLDFFNESYLSLYLRHKVLNNKETRDKLSALEFLYPLNLYDESYLISEQIPLFYSPKDGEFVSLNSEKAQKATPPQEKKPTFKP